MSYGWRDSNPAELQPCDMVFMREIPLTQGKVALVDDEDYEWLMQWKWHVAYRKSRRTDFYAIRTFKDSRQAHPGAVLMHRALAERWGLPFSERYDHKDLNGLNNQRHNIRPASGSQNAQNTPKRKGATSRFKRVSWDKEQRKWRVVIYLNGRAIHHGRFSKESDARRVADAAALKYHGEFACLDSMTQ